MSEIVCPRCGHVEPVTETDPITLADIGLFRCDACQARFVYGRAIPRIVVEPCRGPLGLLWTRVRVFDPETGLEALVMELDPVYADAFADNLRAMTRLGRNPRQRAV